MAEFTFAQKVAIDFETKPARRRRTSAERRASYERTKERVAKAIAKDGGRYVSFSEDVENEKEMGLLVCGLEFEKKLYFLVIDKDRKIQIVHHGQSYKLMHEIPGSLSVLNYIYVHQRNELRGVIENFFDENEEYKLFTDIAIRPVRKNFNSNNRDKKKFVKKEA